MQASRCFYTLYIMIKFHLHQRFIKNPMNNADYVPFTNYKGQITFDRK